MSQLEIELGESKESGPCDCCGEKSRRVWGYVYEDGSAHAVYFVHWTPGKVADHDTNIDLIMGQWGEGTTVSDRFAVSAVFRQGAGIMITNAQHRDVAHSELVTRGLRREEVIGTPLAQQVFDIIDAIWSQDRRIVEVTGVAP